MDDILPIEVLKALHPSGNRDDLEPSEHILSNSDKTYIFPLKLVK
jgi:hypothetical protein